MPLQRILLVLMLAAPIGGVRADEPAMTVDAAKTGDPINPYLYGQFTEMLFNLFEKGVWAEMLSDRKFFYPVNSSAELVPVNKKPFFVRWRPVGPDAFVTMDRARAFVGEWAPEVRLEGDTPHGIQQAGLTLRRDRAYTGHLALAGDPGATVEVSLVWGPGPADRQTRTFAHLASDYVRCPFAFTAGADTADGRLEITGTGHGAFRIGVVSLMPADNLDGFRADMIPLLRELHSGIYRWPGGNFVSGYDWRDGVGDRDTRPPRYDHAWSTVEYNDVGTDEFLTLCRLIGVAPYLCVNAGFGDAHSAAQWVEYVNGAPDTPMGRRRAANGHRAPYGVQWWGIGNEMWGPWQLGYMPVDQFVLKHNAFARAMRAVDPAIRLVACGASPSVISSISRFEAYPPPIPLPYAFGSPQDFSGQLLAHCAANIDFLSEHMYPDIGGAFDLATRKIVPTHDPLVDQVRRMPNAVLSAVEALDEYRRRIPAVRDRNIPLVIDEWAGGPRGSYTSALCVAEGLQEMFRHTDRIAMAGHTSFISSLAFDGAESTYSPTGLVFYLYRNHFGTIPVAVTGNSPPHEVSGTVGIDKPKVTSGSDTYPLDVVAALEPDRRALTVAVVNPTETAQSVRVTFAGLALRDAGTQWAIAAPNLQAQNVPGRPAQVKIVESPLTAVPAALTVAPLSVTLYRFPAR
jgi:alpha-L-arabinofuranosidase